MFSYDKSQIKFANGAIPTNAQWSDNAWLRDNRMDRSMNTAEATTHVVGNTLGVLLAIPTCGISLVLSLSTSILMDGVHNMRYNNATGY